ncbi:HDOD domain-containing protein [Spongiibacter sp. KMU-158]|uniref:HDOD domain-containing protein n=1 Tax=Spongiibacter pelagi TaxID=2760804 RepID=A0A927C4M4_9GAMM|nr:HDOD domain-containing protein [Spongiibacter pelagi]MBD2859927.1 HDOD domain-containing protein [Spongiibacter pelagi]
MSAARQLIDQVREDLFSAIENDSITLPTLPEVALEIRAAANDPEISVAALAAIIEQDGSIATRLIRVGNSSLLRGLEAVSDVKGAISRIGLSYTSTLVTTMAMQQIFLSTKEALNKRMRAIWVHSTDVAAICHTLAKGQKGLKPELATLAGVVHQIGALPILNYAVGRGFLRDHPEALDQVLIDLTPIIGRQILESWGFAPELVIIPEEHLNFDRRPEKADYADLVMVANLHSYVGTNHPLAEVDWATVPAFERLGLPVKPGEQSDSYYEQVETMQELLRG